MARGPDRVVAGPLVGSPSWARICCERRRSLPTTALCLLPTTALCVLLPSDCSTVTRLLPPRSARCNRRRPSAPCSASPRRQCWLTFSVSCGSNVNAATAPTASPLPSCLSDRRRASRALLGARARLGRRKVRTRREEKVDIEGVLHWQDKEGTSRETPVHLTLDETSATQRIGIGRSFCTHR